MTGGLYGIPVKDIPTVDNESARLHGQQYFPSPTHVLIVSRNDNNDISRSDRPHQILDWRVFSRNLRQRIVNLDLPALRPKVPDEWNSWRIARVLAVREKRETKHQHPPTCTGGDTLRNEFRQVLGHPVIDFPCQRDHLGALFPRQGRNKQEAILR